MTTGHCLYTNSLCNNTGTISLIVKRHSQKQRTISIQHWYLPIFRIFVPCWCWQTLINKSQYYHSDNTRSILYTKVVLFLDVQLLGLIFPHGNEMTHCGSAQKPITFNPNILVSVLRIISTIIVFTVSNLTSTQILRWSDDWISTRTALPLKTFVLTSEIHS